MKLKITQADINKANKYRAEGFTTLHPISECCPIACALCRTTHKAIGTYSVYTNRVRVTATGRKVYENTPSAVKVIDAFGSDEEVKPCIVTLKKIND